MNYVELEKSIMPIGIKETSKICCEKPIDG